MDTLSEVDKDIQFSFVLIKPDAMERGLIGRIITRVEETFLRTSGLQERHKNREWVYQHYAHLRNKPFFPQLVAFMISRSMIGFAVGGPHAIARMRKLVGTTNSWEAAPGTIRGDWGNAPAMFNLIHVSDSPAAAEREATLFYDLRTDQVDSTKTEPVD